MPKQPEIPDFARTGPFTRTQARAAGVSDRRLQGRQFARVLPGVWRWTGHNMSDEDLRRAAELALPERAALSHVSRIQRLGLDIGPPEPVHLTIGGDHHLDLPGVFLHRTAVMPPRDGEGVSPAAAFVQCCADLRLLDMVVIGDFLLHHQHATVPEILAACAIHPWRPGARQAPSVLPWLDERSRSPAESQLRAYLVAAGLPTPEVNAEIVSDDGKFLGIGDLWFRRWRLVVEYEGRQHAEDMRQFHRDIDRYAGFRQHDIAYVQVTGAMTPNPVGAVNRVFAALVRAGYDGARPRFGPAWGALFQAVPIPRERGDWSTAPGPGPVDDSPGLRGTG